MHSETTGSCYLVLATWRLRSLLVLLRLVVRLPNELDF